MYSIIVCSIRPEEAEALKANIQKTIGPDVPFEFIGGPVKVYVRSITSVLPGRDMISCALCMRMSSS